MATVLALAVPASAEPQERTEEDEPIRLIGGSDLVLRAVDTLATIRVPLELATDAAPDSAWLVDVVGSRGLREQRMFEAVEVAFAEEGPAPALELTLDLRVLERPDTLGLRIAVRDGARVDNLDLRLRRPAATLRDPAEIRVVRIGGEERITPLVLRETSGLSRVTGLRLESLGFTSDEEPVEITVAVADTAERTVPADGALSLPYRVEGEPPIGTASGSAELRAPALAEPLTVDFEIVSRRSLWWLFLMILSGVCIGWFSRVYLERRSVLGEARRDAEETLARLKGALRRYRDAEFRSAIREEIRKLERVARAGDAESITTAAQAARTELTQKLESLRTELRDVENCLQNFEEVVTRPRHLPSRVREVFAGIAGPIERARQAIQRWDRGAATQVLDDTVEALVYKLKGALNRLPADYAALLEPLKLGAHGLPASVVGPLEALGDEWEDIDGVSGEGTEAIGEALEVMEQHQLRVWRDILQVPGWVAETYEEVRKILPSADPSPELDELGERIGGLRQAVEETEKLEDAVEALTSGELRVAWERALRAQADDDTDVEKLEEYLGRNEYVQAARLLASATAPAPPDTTELSLQSVGSAVAEIDRRAPVDPADIAADEGWESVRRVWQKGWRFREIYLPRALQLIIFAVLIAAIGMLVFADDFVGDVADVTGAFLWGFSLDVTAETVVEKIKALRS